MLRVAAAGMAIPTFATVAGMSTVTLPLAGTVHNIVHEIGSDGVVGVKSGYTSQAAGCMVLAGYRTVGGHTVLVLASALGQSEPTPAPTPATPSASAPTSAPTSAPATVPTTTTTTAPYSPIEAQYPLLYTGPIVEHLLDTTESAVVPVQVAEPGQTVATPTVHWAGSTRREPAEATRSAILLATPGQRVRMRTTAVTTDAAGPGHPPTTVARFTLGAQTVVVPVQLLHRLPDPSWWWKLLHN
jgi:hypothetical protein